MAVQPIEALEPAEKHDVERDEAAKARPESVLAPLPNDDEQAELGESLDDAAHGRKRLITKRTVIIGVVALAVLAGIVAGVAKVFSPSTPVVGLYTVQKQSLAYFVGGGGLTYPAQSLTVSYPVNASVLSVNVQVGQEVQKGQQMLQLDSADLTSQLQQANAQVQIAQQYLNTLYYDGANPSLIASAQAQLTSAQAHYNALSSQLNSPEYSNGAIIAPFNGVVSAVNVTAGTVATMGTPLITLQDASTVIVYAELPLEQRSLVQIGQNVSVTPDATPDQTFHGKVITINPTLVNAGSDTFEAWISIPNPSLQLLLNESVYVRISSQESLPTVPQLAVINPDADAIVFVYSHGRAHLRHVVVGVRDGDRFGIVSGLNPGDQVILVGQYQL